MQQPNLLFAVAIGFLGDIQTMLVYHFLFFFNDTATTEIYTLSLHDALRSARAALALERRRAPARPRRRRDGQALQLRRSEEHTSELQSPCNLVCRLLLE